MREFETDFVTRQVVEHETPSADQPAKLKPVEEGDMEIVFGGVSPQHMNGTIPFDYERWRRFPYIG